LIRHRRSHLSSLNFSWDCSRSPICLYCTRLSSVSLLTLPSYYDLTNSLCGNNDPFPSNWAETSGINSGIPYCEYHALPGKSLAELGTNRIVAVNASAMDVDAASLCGKQVSIKDASGNEFSFSEGPLFIWDACDAARTVPIVDLSAKAFSELKGNTCSGNNPTGLTISIMDNNVWQPISKRDEKPRVRSRHFAQLD
jgi:hypothetical protein